jgi:predicted nucleic acid-binding protein
MAGYDQSLVLDWSAYTRVLVAQAKGPGPKRLSSAQVKRFEEATAADELYVCPPFRLEARYSARSPRHFAVIESQLRGFMVVDADADTWPLAVRAQEDLANASGISHRVKPVDLLVAAIAHQHRLGVLHYDKDYEALAEHTRLSFASRWIAPKGSVD